MSWLSRVVLAAYPGWFRARRREELIDFWRRLEAEPRYRGIVGWVRLLGHALGELAVALKLRLTRERAAGDLVDRHRDRRLGSTLAALALASRTALRAPIFSGAVVLTLALGIGAASAVFAVVESVLLRPLDYPEAERLVAVATSEATGDVTWPDYRDWRDGASTVAGLAGYTESSANFEWPEGAEHVEGARVTANSFELLGVAPILGRSFSADEDRFGGAAAMVLSHSLWVRHFGGDSSVIGRSVPIEGGRVPVVGVMPPGFRFPTPTTEYWRPLQEDQVLAAAGLPTGTRRLGFLSVVGRLAPGATPKAASAELESIARRHDDERGGEPTEVVTVRPLLDSVVGGSRATLLLLLASVGLVFVVACANVAGLMVSRVARRQQELVVRAALGASRTQLAGTLLAESAVLALFAGGCSLAVAALLIRGLKLVAPPGIPRVEQIELAAPSLLVAAGLTVLAGLVLGAAPALGAARRHSLARVASGLGLRGGAGAGQRTQRLLVAAQVAAAVVLLGSSALLANSFLRIMGADRGFDAGGLLVSSITPPEEGYGTPERVEEFYARLRARLEALPGVTSVATTYSAPLFGNELRVSIAVEGDEHAAPAGSPNRLWTGVVVVSDDYFATTGTPLLAGRSFGPDDRLDALPVAIVSKTTAARLWPGEDPIGKRFRLTGGLSGSADSFDRRFFPREWHTVVGVAGDVRRSGLSEAPSLEIYRPHAQISWGFQYLLVRAERSLEGIAAGLEREVWAIDPRVPVTDVRAMGAQVDASMAGPRFRMLLLSTFAGLASALVLVGIYGVTALSVARREREIGIRMALGAGRRRVLVEVLRDGLRVAAVGLAVGLALTALVARSLRSMLYEIAPTDPLTYLIVALVIGGVALLATWLPARRASRIDPVRTLDSG
ncbi:MAG: ABC transporter permease [Gemmatimonadales bacterium]